MIHQLGGMKNIMDKRILVQQQETLLNNARGWVVVENI